MSLSRPQPLRGTVGQWLDTEVVLPDTDLAAHGGMYQAMAISGTGTG